MVCIFWLRNTVMNLTQGELSSPEFGAITIGLHPQNNDEKDVIPATLHAKTITKFSPRTQPREFLFDAVGATLVTGVAFLWLSS